MAAEQNNSDMTYGTDVAFAEAERLVRKFFPESQAFLHTGVGLHWEAILGAMMAADYKADHSCDPFRSADAPNLGLAEKGGVEGNDSDVYRRLLEHTQLQPTGRAVVIPDGIGATGWSDEQCLPFVCDAACVPERLDEESCSDPSRDTIFVYESGEALMVDHDQRIHWARTKEYRHGPA